MGDKQKICYSCIGRRGVVLVSYRADWEPTNFTNTIHSVLCDVPAEGTAKLTYPCNSFQIHILVDGGMVYACATDITSKHYSPFVFLENLKIKFQEQISLVSRALYAGEDEFDRDFGPVMSRFVDDFNMGRGDKVSQLRAQVDDVKQIMLDNVEKVIDRGERLDELLTKTEDLESQGNAFRQRAREIQKKACCANVKMWAILGMTAAIILSFIVLFSTGVIPTS